MDITQDGLAKRVNVSKQTINTIEAGKYIPSTLLALKIATIFNKAVEDIFILEASDWKK